MRRHCRALLAITLIAMASLLSAQSESADARRARGESVSPPIYDSYIIQSGDTLILIAQRFKTTVGRLLAANAMGENEPIIAGSAILVPAWAGAPAEVYEVQAGDTLFSIARRFKTSVGMLKHLNDLGDEDAIVVGEKLLRPAADGGPGVGVDQGRVSPESPSIDESAFAIHIVRSGDTLFDLARLYHTTVARLSQLNGAAGRADLAVGQRLIVPKVDDAMLEQYIARPGDTLDGIAQRYGIELAVLRALNRWAGERDLRAGSALLAPKPGGPKLALRRVKPGDTLEAMAQEYGTTVAALQALNGIADPGLIVLGELIVVPKPRVTLARTGFGFGLQVFIEGARAEELAQRAKALGANWVKLDVSWARIETAPQIYSYSALDNMVAALELAGVKILLNVYDAPAWSRKRYNENLNRRFREYTGPPDDYADFTRFLANLVARYAGLVDAYEIWKSPNLLKFWSAPVYAKPRARGADGDYGIPDSIQIGARYYAPLLEMAYETIKARDEKALVVAAGLAPAGFSDHYNSIDTGAFLNNLLLAGAADYSDAIGAIFSASAAPPTLACCDKPPGVDTHYESFLQYYGDLLAFYDETLRAHGVGLPLFVTQLGWGTTEGANLAVAATGFEWLKYTSEDEQALYVAQAYRIAQKLEYVGAIFLYNLNGCAARDAEACFFSLEDAAGRLRPAYDAFQSIPKSDA